MLCSKYFYKIKEGEKVWRVKKSNVKVVEKHSQIRRSLENI